MTEVVRTATTQCNLGIGQSQIRIKQHYFKTHALQSNSKIDRNRGLAHAAFAAGNAYNLCGTWLLHVVLRLLFAEN